MAITPTLHAKLDALKIQMTGMQTALDASIVVSAAIERAQDDKLAAILALIGAGAEPALPPPPPPSVLDWPPAPPIVAGQTITIGAGTRTGVANFDVPVIVQGAGMRATVLDGQGGASFGKRLAWGKGVIHANATYVTVQDLTITHAGQMGDGSSGPGAQSGSDGEAGIYAESGGAVLLVRCLLKGNENGVFVPPFAQAGALVDLTIDACWFEGNGLSDGRSHDIYAGAKTATIRDSVFKGDSRGNTIKIRGPHLMAEDNWIGRSNGRWLDFPGGTEAVTRRNIFVTLPGATSNNAIGLYDEDDVNASPSTGSWLSEDDTFIFSRHTEIIWNNRPGLFNVAFVRPKVFWVGAAGSTPPRVVYSSDVGGGAALPLSGNPFVFSEANRLNAAPDPA